MRGIRKIKWGDGLAVTDEGNGVIRVDAGGGGGGGGGIQFDTNPQSGGFLLTSTTGDTDFIAEGDLSLEVDGTGTEGLYLYADNAAGGYIALETASSGGEIFMNSEQINLRLKNSGTLEIQDSGGNVFLSVGENGPIALDSPTNLLLDAQDLINITTADNQINITANGVGGSLNMFSMANVISAYGALGVWLQTDGAAGSYVKVMSGATEVFRVEPDGSLRGKSGKSLVFNL